MSTTRRNFLKMSLGGTALASLGASMPTLGSPTSRHADRDTVLVVVQLAGGNDGLNTVVPYTDDQYAKHRRTLRLTDRQVHKIDAELGFHPKMKTFKRLYDAGHLTVMQGVGYPNATQSHPRSMEIWQTAAPDQTNCQTGWLGRMVDRRYDPSEVHVPAMFVGNLALPRALRGERVEVPSIRSLQECTLQTMPGEERTSFGSAEQTEEPSSLLNFVRRGSQVAEDASKKIEAVARAAASGTAYPSFQLASRFQTIAQLIRADLGIRVFYTELGGNQPGGFDNHANQLGNHDALLHELSESVGALVDDLKHDRLLDRVLLVTFSEFGRTLAENGRRGTGHGEAAPMFLAGGRVSGGLIGRHPDLTDLRNGSPKFHTDFRQVYATLLARWLGFESRPILGGDFQPLDVLSDG